MSCITASTMNCTALTVNTLLVPSVPNSMAQLRKVTGYKVQWNCTVSSTNSEFAKKMKCSILFTFQVGNLEAWFYDRSRIVTINRNHIEHQVPNVSFETQHSLSLGTDLSGTLVSSNAKISIIRFCSHDTKLQPKTYLFLFQNIRIFVLRFFFLINSPPEVTLWAAMNLSLNGLQHLEELI